MFHVFTQSLTDGQFWALAFYGAFIIVAVGAMLECAAEVIREGAK